MFYRNWSIRKNTSKNSETRKDPSLGSKLMWKEMKNCGNSQVALPLNIYYIAAISNTFLKTIQGKNQLIIIRNSNQSTCWLKLSIKLQQENLLRYFNNC